MACFPASTSKQLRGSTVLYASCLGGSVRLLDLHRFAGSPMGANAPAGWDQKIMHAGPGTEGQPFAAGL